MARRRLAAPPAPRQHHGHGRRAPGSHQVGCIYNVSMRSVYTTLGAENLFVML